MQNNIKAAAVYKQAYLSILPIAYSVDVVAGFLYTSQQCTCGRMYMMHTAPLQPATMSLLRLQAVNG